MKVPLWFRVLAALWLVIGLPALLVGAMWYGGFDLVPDPAPYFQAPYGDGYFLANLAWAVAVMIAYMPLFLIPALAIWWLKRKDEATANVRFRPKADIQARGE
jgi:hypothetical protein